MIVALSRLLPPFPARSCLELKEFIADNPVAIPMLLSVTALDYRLRDWPSADDQDADDPLVPQATGVLVD